MAKSVHLYSTLACDNVYAIYAQAKEGEQRRQIAKDKNGKPMKLTVKGGHGVANKNIITPFGVHTEVDAEIFELLENNPAFKRHVERRFIEVSKTKKDVNKVAKDLSDKDKGKPKTQADFKQKESNSAE